MVLGSGLLTPHNHFSRLVAIEATKLYGRTTQEAQAGEIMVGKLLVFISPALQIWAELAYRNDFKEGVRTLLVSIGP